MILARELAANLATPMYLIEAASTLVFSNEAAELMLGKTWAAMGEMTAEQFGTMLDLAEPDGTPMRKSDSPAGVAFFQRAPSHKRVIATTLDGKRTTFEATAYPLFGRTEDMHGVLTVFWEAKE